MDKRKHPPGKTPEEKIAESVAAVYRGAENRQFTPSDYKKSLKGLDWVGELNTLGSNWVPKSPGMEIQFKLQCGYAYTLTLAGVHILCADDLARSPDEEDWTRIIMKRLETDIEKYDPKRSTLGQRMISQIKRRKTDAIRVQNKEKNRDEFLENIRLLEDWLLKDPGLLADPVRFAEWADEVSDELFVYHYRRVDSLLKKKEQRAAARADLLERLKGIEPGQGNLMAFCKSWARDVLKGEYVAPQHISVDTHVGEEEEGGTLGEILPGSAPDPEEVVESNEAVLLLLQIITLNFLKLRERGIQWIEEKNAGPQKPAQKTVRDIHRKILHYQLMFTEQIASYASRDPLPREYGNDILAVFSEPYYRFFAANIRPEDVLSLGILEQTQLKMARDIDPDDTDDGPLRWKEHGFLEYKVMHSFLESLKLRPSLSTIKKHREKYIKALQKLYLEKAGS